jgi:hypothetical protein
MDMIDVNNWIKDEYSYPYDIIGDGTGNGEGDTNSYGNGHGWGQGYGDGGQGFIMNLFYCPNGGGDGIGTGNW